MMELPGGPGLRIAMVAYSFYENDGRVMRYAQALARERAEVVVYCLRREGQPRQATIDGVRVIRVQARTKNESGGLQYLARVVRFLAVAAWQVARAHGRTAYQLVHVHSVPDFLVLTALLPRLLGAKVILDIHDILPEFCAAKFPFGQHRWMAAALRLVERSSARLSDHVIIANDLWHETLTSRSVARSKCSTFINYPDLQIFRPAPHRESPAHGFSLVYPGSLNRHQGVDIAIEAVAIARRVVSGLKFDIYGEGSERPGLERLVRERGLVGDVVFHPPLPLTEIASVMSRADIGVVPKRNDGFGGDAFSTKILEFMALGVPVLVSATRIDRHYFDDGLVGFFEPGNVDALAAAIVEADRDRATLAARAERGLRYASENAWHIKSSDYIDLVRGLVGVGV